jgi:hypothetical protein
MNNNDAAARAALYTEDAVMVTDPVPIYSRNAVEKWFANLFQKVHISDQLITIDQDSPHSIRLAMRCGPPELNAVSRAYKRSRMEDRQRSRNY